jgi:hypothetical protein
VEEGPVVPFLQGELVAEEGPVVPFLQEAVVARVEQVVLLQEEVVELVELVVLLQGAVVELEELGLERLQPRLSLLERHFLQQSARPSEMQSHR